MLIVTGGAGFIGSALVQRLNSQGRSDVVIVDALGSSSKWKNLVGLRYRDYVHKDSFFPWLNAVAPSDITGVVHLGACSSTTEADVDYLFRNNTHFTRELMRWSVTHGVRLVYASSAATYGDGTLGFRDDDATTRQLRPLNPYGYSKQRVDVAALDDGSLGKVAGVKFFNVFGPNEYHKGSMRSMVLKAFEQISATRRIQLFRSYREGFSDGEQRRDFVYVKDCVDALVWLLDHVEVNGLFNLGSNAATTWNRLADAIFKSMGIAPAIDYVDMPDNIRHAYQYYTQAEIQKIRDAGWTCPMTPIDEAVDDYVKSYLQRDFAYL